MKNSLSLFFILAAVGSQVWAQGLTVSNSGIEMNYQYQVTVRGNDRGATKPSGQEIAKFHSDHIFGMFHSPLYAAKRGFPQELNEGFVGAKYPNLEILKVFKEKNDDYWSVTYRAEGKALVLKVVADQWQGSRSGGYKVSLPLVTNLPEIYTDDLERYKNNKWKECTDPDFPKTIDFSYFYDPFRCSELGQSPLGQTVDFNFQPVTAPRVISEFPAGELQGDNGNGRLEVYYFALGFDSALKKGSPKSKIKRDDGYLVYQAFIKRLTQDFEFTEVTSEAALKTAMGADRAKLKLNSPVSMDHFTQRRFYRTFVSEVRGNLAIVRLGLFDSQNLGSDGKLTSFATFWKEAWQNGDLVYYGGHSGDGISLEQDRLMMSVDPTGVARMRPAGKTQIGFLDGCSTYNYYQDMYKEAYPNVHLLTYGVVSLYHAAEATMVHMLSELLIAEPGRDWEKVLAGIEEEQLLPHYQFLYGDEEGRQMAERSRRKSQFPNFMLNVWVP